MVDFFETDMVFAHVCRKKGSDADVLEAMMADIEVLGHRQIVFKGDQETSITALQRELAARRLEMRLDNSPNYHSVANGRVENAVQRVIGFTRSLTDALEANIRQPIEPNMPVMTFMVNHAATIMNRFSADQDGRTSMEKARGTAANREMAEFGEKNPVPTDAKVQEDAQARRGGGSADCSWEYRRERTKSW